MQPFINEPEARQTNPNRKHNFYFRTQSQRNESVEVYVGKSSVKQLNEDILNAQREVLIISPYIDESKLDELIALKNRGVNIRLAFSDLRNEQRRSILRKLIHQQKDVNVNLKEKVAKRIHLYSIRSIAALVIGIFLLLFTLFMNKSIIYANTPALFLSLFCFFLFNKLSKKKKMMERIPIYSYEYFEKINFKYLRNHFQYGNHMFIHSKIYIIDRKTAYLGSLNFTTNGFTNNFETRIRITNSDKIAELVDFVHNIFDDNQTFEGHQINFLGRQAYSEELY